MNNLEKRLSKIEADLKSLKAAYQTSGTNVRLYVSKQSFNVTIPAGSSALVKIKFVPNFGRGKVIMANLVGKVTRISGAHSFFSSYQQTQDGSGDVVIAFPFIDYSSGQPTSVRLDVVASATSPGTFTRIS